LRPGDLEQALDTGALSLHYQKALASLGVEIVQGYLYGPEVTPAELRTLITRPGGPPA
jgi:hypothetical protein